MNNKNKYNKFFLILSFFIPIIIIICNYIPFYIKNPNFMSFLHLDASAQYYSLLKYFKSILNGTNSIFYSFTKNLGGNFINTYSYYLSSPFNLLLIFFNNQNISLFFFISTLIKIGLASTTMYIFLSKTLNKIDYKLLIFSSAYALTDYNIAYYFNIMWLDIILLTPLIMLGIYNIVHNCNYKLYLVSLSISIFSNYYLSYMVCIFSIIYFTYEFILNFENIKNNNSCKKVITEFILISILSVLISSIILIPTILDINNFSRFQIEIQNNINIYDDFISKFFIGTRNPNDILSIKSINLYFGLFPLILSIHYFFNKKIDKKEKVLSSMIILIFIVSFFINKLTLIYHGGSLPNAYNYRFSFLLDLFLIIISAKNLYKTEKFEIKHLLIVSILLIITILIKDNNLLNYKFILSLIFIIIYTILLYNKKNGIYILLIFLFELFLNTNFNFYYLNVNNLLGENEINTYCNSITKYEDDNHRIDYENRITALDSFLCNTKSISGALSTNNKKVYNFAKKIGLSTTSNSLYYNSNITTSTLLGINYETSLNKYSNHLYTTQIFGDNYDNWYNLEKDNDLYQKIDEINLNNNSFDIYKLKYTLPIGYMINNDYNSTNNYNYFEYQNNIFKSFAGNDENIYNIYNIIDLENNEYITTIDNSDYLYIYLNTTDIYIGYDIADIYINGEFICDTTYFNNGIFTIKNKWKNEKINIKIIEKDNYDTAISYPHIFIASLNKNKFIDDINILNQNTLNITNISKNTLKGNIITDKSGYLFLSIPYEKGYTLLINGKKEKIDTALDDTFIKIYLNKGTYNIELKYIPPGFTIGSIISFISILTSFILLKSQKNKL